VLTEIQHAYSDAELHGYLEHAINRILALEAGPHPV
jgi:hypothetical protein